MEVYVTTKANRVAYIKIDGEEVKYITEIIDKYVESKGYKIRNGYLTDESEVKLYLPLYDEVYNDNDVDCVYNYEYEKLENKIQELKEEVVKAIKEMEKEQTQIITLD